MNKDHCKGPRGMTKQFKIDPENTSYKSECKLESAT